MIINENIPSEKDWDGYKGGLDEKCAYSHFCGKTQGQAYQMFKEASSFYREDLSYMPEKAFRFYLEPFMQYLLSSDSKEDAEAASGFLSLIKLTLDYQPNYLTGLWDRIDLTFSFLCNYQESFFDADESIFGRFKNKVKQIKKKRES